MPETPTTTEKPTTKQEQAALKTAQDHASFDSQR